MDRHASIELGLLRFIGMLAMSIVCPGKTTAVRLLSSEASPRLGMIEAYMLDLDFVTHSGIECERTER